MSDILEVMGRLGTNAQPFCLVQVVDSRGPVPRAAGAMMVVTTDGIVSGSIGGGSLEARMEKEALASLNDGKSRFLNLDLDRLKMNCGGHVKVLIQPIGVQQRLVIFGAGHVGMAVARLFAWQGFAVTMIEPRESDEELPRGVTIIRNADDKKMKDLIDSQTFVVIATSSHTTDQKVLQRVLPLQPRYLGLLSSPAKWKGIMQALQTKGFDDKDLQKVHAPVGLWIHAETPGEIAISIAAEIISEFRRSGDE